MLGGAADSRAGGSLRNRGRTSGGRGEVAVVKRQGIGCYAQQAGITNVQTELDLGSGVAMPLTLIPASRIVMGAA